MQYEKKYWFPAKTYGWGWGTPSTRQGWVVLVAFISSTGLSFLIAPPDSNPIAFFACQAAAIIIFFFVLWKKGEPVQWRWGRK